MAFLTGVRWSLTVVLICIFLIIGNSDTEHLFMSLLVIHVSSLEKYLFRFSVHFLSFALFSGCAARLQRVRAAPPIVVASVWSGDSRHMGFGTCSLGLSGCGSEVLASGIFPD